MWQPMSSAILKAYQRQRWRNSAYGPKQCRRKQTKRFLGVCVSLYVVLLWLWLEREEKKKKTVTAKYHFHHMMKLLPKGSNNFQDANCPRSTGWVVNDNWAAVYYEFITAKCIICSFDMNCVNLSKSLSNENEANDYCLEFMMSLETVICVGEGFGVVK